MSRHPSAALDLASLTAENLDLKTRVAALQSRLLALLDERIWDKLAVSVAMQTLTELRAGCFFFGRFADPKHEAAYQRILAGPHAEPERIYDTVETTVRAGGC